MKPFAIHPNSRSRERSAFTMVEIALCIAVVSIAMVAIIGVLPAGLNVQRLNREEAVLTQDAELLLNAIRNGQSRLQELTNFVDRITLIREYPDGSPASTNFYHGPLVAGTPAGSQRLEDAFQILGLVSRPKYTSEPSVRHRTVDGATVINTVRMEMRTMSGSMADHPIIQSGSTRTPGSDPRIDFAFRYLVTVETVVRQRVRVPGDDTRPLDTMNGSITEVRLTLEWPLLRNGVDPLQYRMGLNRREFRTEVLGRPHPLMANIPQNDRFFGAVVFPYRRVSSTPNPDDVILYRLQPGAL
jgi:type II secretory pathway pseudopilin PulG